MYLTGFADEAAGGIDGQIRATQQLGWSRIETRNVDGRNIHDLSEQEFDRVAGALDSAGIQVNCFGSAIANWGKRIDEPMDSSLAEARRAIGRMQRLGTKLVRIMSFAVREDRAPDDQMEQERFGRLRELVKMFADAGLQAVHENCMNYGGMGYTYTLRLLEQVPGLKLVFDTGNPVFSADRAKPQPWPRQSSWQFYQHVKEHVVYVHIKDGRWEEHNQQTHYTFPGEGDGDVERIVKDLLKGGYDGGFSIEPHMAVVMHDQSIQACEQAKFDNYIEYGRRMMALIDKVKVKSKKVETGKKEW